MEIKLQFKWNYLHYVLVRKVSSADFVGQFIKSIHCGYLLNCEIIWNFIFGNNLLLQPTDSMAHCHTNSFISLRNSFPQKGIWNGETTFQWCILHTAFELNSIWTIQPKIKVLTIVLNNELCLTMASLMMMMMCNLNTACSTVFHAEYLQFNTRSRA